MLRHASLAFYSISSFATCGVYTFVVIRKIKTKSIKLKCVKRKVKMFLCTKFSLIDFDHTYIIYVQFLQNTKHRKVFQGITNYSVKSTN